MYDTVNRDGYYNKADRIYADEQRAIRAAWVAKQKAKRGKIVQQADKVELSVEKVAVSCCGCGETVYRSHEVIKQAERAGRPGVYCPPCRIKRITGWSSRKQGLNQ